MDMVCFNFGESQCWQFSTFLVDFCRLSHFSGCEASWFHFGTYFPHLLLRCFLKSRVCVLFNLIVFYLTIFATENKIKMTECIVNTQVFLVAQCMGCLESGRFWKIIITNLVFNRFWQFQRQIDVETLYFLMHSLTKAPTDWLCR